MQLLHETVTRWLNGSSPQFPIVIPAAIQTAILTLIPISKFPKCQDTSLAFRLNMDCCKA